MQRVAHSNAQSLVAFADVPDCRAETSDILPGDVITAVDGSGIDSGANFNELISARGGQTVELAIIRQGTTISKMVTLRQ